MTDAVYQEALQQIEAQTDRDVERGGLKKGETRDDRILTYIKQADKQVPGLHDWVVNNKGNGEPSPPSLELKVTEDIPPEAEKFFREMVKASKLKSEVYDELVKEFLISYNGSETSQYDGKQKIGHAIMMAQSNIMVKYSRPISSYTYIPVYSSSFSWTKQEQVQVEGKEKGTTRLQNVTRHRASSFGIINDDGKIGFGQITAWDEKECDALGSLSPFTKYAADFDGKGAENIYKLNAIQTEYQEIESLDEEEIAYQFADILESTGLLVQNLGDLDDMKEPKYTETIFVRARIGRAYPLQNTKNDKPYARVKFVPGVPTPKITTISMMFFDEPESVYDFDEGDDVIIICDVSKGTDRYPGAQFTGKTLLPAKPEFNFEFMEYKEGDD